MNPSNNHSTQSSHVGRKNGAMAAKKGPPMPPMLDAALAFAFVGYRVFPQHTIINGRCTCGKNDCASPGKHPREKGWKEKATTNIAQITKRWQAAESNIGILLGPARIGLDLDPRHGSDEWLAKLEQDLGPLPATVEWATGGGGRHLIFAWPEQVGHMTSIAPGIEVKEWLTAPPSRHISGARYESIRSPNDCDVAELPAAWLDRLRIDKECSFAPRADTRSMSHLPGDDGLVGPGGRHAFLVSEGGKAARDGESRERIEARVREQNASKCSPPLPDAEATATARDLATRYGQEQGRRPRLQTPDLAAVEPVRWLWRGRILLGGLNLLVGEEGAGKSTAAAYILARASRGELDGDLSGEAAPCLIVGAEDSLARVWTPRLYAASADRAQIKYLDAPEGITITTDLPLLREVVSDTGTRLVYFDQIVDNLPSNVDEWKAKSVRKALTPLISLAGELDFALVAALHTNKSGKRIFRQAVSGSHAFNALARSSLLVAAHPEGPDDARVLARAKGNYSKRPASLRFRIQEERPTINGNMIETSVATDFCPCGLTADQLLAGPRPENHSKAELARVYISEQLADGQKHSTKPIYDYLLEMGVSKSTIGQARREVGAEQEKLPGFQSGNVWWLPGKAATSQPEKPAANSKELQGRINYEALGLEEES